MISDKDILEKAFCTYVDALCMYKDDCLEHGESISLYSHEIRNIVQQIERICYLLDGFFLEHREGEFELSVCKKQIMDLEQKENNNEVLSM